MTGLRRSPYAEAFGFADGVKTAAWYWLASAGWSLREIADADPKSYVASDIAHHVRLYAERHCLPVPSSCARRHPKRPRKPAR